MNRIDQKFKALRKLNKKAFIAFLTAGYPDLKTTEELVVAFEKVGVDIVEIGVPFSDPMADGKTIQAASQKALEHQVTLAKILQLVKRIRTRSQIPIALMSYYNPVFHFGNARFIAQAKAAGVDGVIVPDLPPEEAKDLIKAARAKNIATVFFLAPTTSKYRIKRIADASSGFVYYVSVTGITGTGQSIATDSIGKHIKQVKQFTDKPICVGFGVSTPEQVRSIANISDGVIVGSEIIRRIERNRGKKDLVKRVAGFVKNLSSAIEKETITKRQ